MIEAMFEWLGNTPLGTLMAENDFAFPWIECIHVLALCITVGSIVVIDLRLLGFLYRDWSIQSMTKNLLPMTWGGFSVALITGIALLSSNALFYLDNPAFRLKMLFMAIAGLNMMIFHFVSAKNIELLDKVETLPAAARLAGGVSIACWLMVVGTGRWIGFISPW